MLQFHFILFDFLFFFFFSFLAGTPTAYGSSQPRGRITAIAPGLHYSHSNAGSEPPLESSV